MSSSKPRILYLDAYDSFANNIISLLQTSIQAEIEVIKHDDSRFSTRRPTAFYEFLSHFDAVVAGPGPGDPRNPTDVGLISLLWRLPEIHQLPVLGICLGFQSMCLAFGEKVGAISTMAISLGLKIIDRKTEGT
jgi:para-aminobenzoate synthetase